MPLSEHALTTYTTAKEELGLTDDSQQAIVERIINAASNAIEMYCGRHFEKTTLTEKIAGKGGMRIVLSRTPVLSIAEVKIDGATIDSSEYELEDAEAGIVFRVGGWPWTAKARVAGITQPRIPGSEEKSIEVAYIGGYVLPKDDGVPDPRTLPYAIEEACLLYVATLWKRRGEDMDIASEKLGDASYSYNRQGIPDAVKQMLQPWRRIV